MNSVTGMILIYISLGYLGFDTMNDYNVAQCAIQCTNKFGCVSFNIYFERDPSGKHIIFLFNIKT
jgi:hypothetical protein